MLFRSLSGLSVNNIAANGEFAFIAWSAFLLVAALVIPAVMFTYTPSENFAAHVNHARERGEIFLFHVALVAMPRWAYATIGITFVLATIFFFRGDPNGTYLAAFCSQLARNSNVLAAIIFASGLGGWLAARDWRALPACIGLPLLTAGIATWTATRVPPMPGAQSDLPFLIQTIVAGAIVVLATGSWSYYRRCGENVVGATAHTLEEFGILAIFCVAVVTAIAPLIRVGMEALAFAAETWLNVAVAVMLANEITVVMDDIFPRHRPVEDIFGRRDTRNKSSL